MAIKQTSRRITLQLSLTLFLGWLGLIFWSTYQWIIHGYAYAYQRIDDLAHSQEKVISPIYESSSFAHLPLQLKPVGINISVLNNLPKLNGITDEFLKKAGECFQLYSLTTQYLLIKLLIAIAALPLFSLAAIAGLVDGLNQRAIRTACLGRESSYVFHKLNQYLKKALIVFFLLWLLLPISVNPSLVFVPISMLIGSMVAITASRFKKYL
ncbi:TIGR03747 family integrating conjugative element membrane protein [Legionella septentrionalis]|uniref:TIGR03747 family integrating conjugative element membrane protein n=1 Tax=Legionella septentrionalis TaxID=2498109 RepID=A0A3S0VA70_9GAMM|nr:TIGR03747 family integrating conjugative element membrane protein [Legionella septentrionalis]RUQ85140.1 TIGR03747 family integrating conjugative element membrane protein [Legionella septentrionalis]